MGAISTDLNLRIRRDQKAIPDSDFPKLQSEAAAIKYAIENSRLQDKSVAIEIGTDAGTLSKAKAGQARLNEDALDRLADASGYEAALYAHCLRRGYDPSSLRRFETDVERENRELKERLAQAEHDNLVLVRAFRGQTP